MFFHSRLSANSCFWSWQRQVCCSTTSHQPRSRSSNIWDAWIRKKSKNNRSIKAATALLQENVAVQKIFLSCFTGKLELSEDSQSTSVWHEHPGDFIDCKTTDQGSRQKLANWKISSSKTYSSPVKVHTKIPNTLEWEESHKRKKKKLEKRKEVEKTCKWLKKSDTKIGRTCWALIEGRWCNFWGCCRKERLPFPFQSQCTPETGQRKKKTYSHAKRSWKKRNFSWKTCDNAYFSSSTPLTLVSFVFTFRPFVLWPKRFLPVSLAESFQKEF